MNGNRFPVIFLAIVCGLMLSVRVYADGAYAGGSGTAEDPYRISMVAHWQELIDTPDDYDKHFILTADLDFGGAAIMPVAPDTSTSMGFQGTKFTGVINGNGHVLHNALISGYHYVGLFGYIGAGGQIRNLGMENIAIGGYGYLGGLCGYNENGTITACYSTGAVTGGTNSNCLGGLCGYNEEGTITACYSTGAVHGGAGTRPAYLGGLCGFNDSGTISACYAIGTVVGEWGADYLGGLCGTNYYGTVSQSYAIGDIAGGSFTDYLGGLCGSNSGMITNCYATGAVAGWNSSKVLGGFCGNNSGVITACYSTGVVTWGTNPGNIGGFCGSGSPDVINNCYFLDTSGPDNGLGTPLSDPNMRIQSSFVGWDFVDEETNGSEDIWRMCVDGIEYPKLYWQFTMGDFTCPDGVEMLDLWYFCNQWLAEGDTLRCDIAPVNHPDDIVNLFDYVEFVKNWMME